MSLVPEEFYVVYSISNSPYQEWQADLLDFSARRAGQPGTLVRLCSQDPAYPQRPVPVATSAFTFATPSFSAVGHPVVGSAVRWAKRRVGLASVGRFDFPCLNKPYGMRAFLDAHDPPDNARLLWLDPDMIFHRAWRPPLECNSMGNVCGQRWWRFDTRWFEHALSPSERRAIPPVETALMFPFCMRVADLRRILDDFCELTLRIYRKTRDWRSEMAALVVSIGLAGLRVHTVPNLAPCNNWPDGLPDDASAPFAHYTQAMKDRAGNTIWDKRDYGATGSVWDTPPDPRTAATRVDRRTLRMLHRFLDAQGPRAREDVGSMSESPAPGSDREGRNNRAQHS